MSRANKNCRLEETQFCSHYAEREVLIAKSFLFDIGKILNDYSFCRKKEGKHRPSIEFNKFIYFKFIGG